MERTELGKSVTCITSTGTTGFLMSPIRHPPVTTHHAAPRLRPLRWLEGAPAAQVARRQAARPPGERISVKPLGECHPKPFALECRSSARSLHALMASDFLDLAKKIGGLPRRQ